MPLCETNIRQNHNDCFTLDSLLPHHIFIICLSVFLFICFIIRKHEYFSGSLT